MTRERELGEFRTSIFGGFDRQDVIEYIKYQASEYEALREENSRLYERISTLEAKADDLERSLHSAEIQTENAKEELNNLNERISQLQGEKGGLESDVEKLKESIAVIQKNYGIKKKKGKKQKNDTLALETGEVSNLNG